MESLFLKLVNLSITATWLVLAVLLIRIVFRKAPRWIFCLLWGLVALRLLCPVSIESAFSLIPSAEPLPQDILYTTAPQIQSGVRVIDDLVNPMLSESMSPAPGASVNPTQVLSFLFSWIWVLGATAMLLYELISYFLLRRRVAAATLLKENISQCDRIPSPFVLGIFRPVIYLPYSVPETDLAYVIAHEQAHIRRRDHWWKPLGFALLSVYWFNPLLWLAYVLLCRDIEGACDEKVIRGMEKEDRRAYSTALLRCSVRSRAVAACPLAFGETGVKSRIRNVMNYKKPAFWILAAVIILSIIAAVCFLTNPRSRHTAISAELGVFLDGQIVEHHRSDSTEGNFIAIDYRILDVEKASDETTVYMWVLYNEYSLQNGALRVEAGAHTPTIVTARRTDSAGHSEEHYELAEYWEPRDGSYYADDIQAKFPRHLWNDALNSQKYIDAQEAFCEESAREYFGLSLLEQYRTDYIGDAPKVAQIAQLLPYPEDYRYSSIELQTDAEPYELMVRLSGSGSMERASFEEAAAIAFEMIGNLGTISFWQENADAPLADFARNDFGSDTQFVPERFSLDGGRLHMEYHVEYHAEYRKEAASGSVSRDRETELSFYWGSPAEEHTAQAVLYVGDGYSVYIPENGWLFSETKYGGCTAQTWQSASADTAKIQIINLGEAKLQEAQTFVRENEPGYTLIEDKQGGLGGYNAENNLTLMAGFCQAGGSLFAVLWRCDMGEEQVFEEVKVIAETFAPN